MSWEDASAFCQRLTEREREAGRIPSDWDYVLPTEAQWEYACRATARTHYGYGDDQSRLSDFAWFSKNTRIPGMMSAQEVGRKKPNRWGLHDMHGNVWELCADGYSDALVGGLEPTPPKDGPNRSLRGGCWYGDETTCGSANRHWIDQSSRSSLVGFRVALRWREKE